MRRCSSPEANMLRRRLSSHTLWPASSSCCSWLLTYFSYENDERTLTGCERKRIKCDLRDELGSEAQALGDGRHGGGFAEAIEAVGDAAVADPLTPPKR